MTIYIILILILIFGAFIAKNNKANNIIVSCLVLFLACMAGLRDGIGNDWQSYKDIYEIYRFYNLKSAITLMEPGFSIIAYVFNNMGFSYNAFLLCLSIISLFIISIILRQFNSPNFYISLLLYFVLFYFQFQMNIMRHGLMASFVWLAFSHINHLKKFLFYIFIGSLFHILAIAFLPFYFFLKHTFNKYQFWSIIIISIFFFSISIADELISSFSFVSLLQTEIDYYTQEYDTAAYGITMGSILNLLITVCAYYCLKNSYCFNLKIRILVNSLLCSFVLTCLLNSYAIFVERFVSILNMTLIILLPYLVYSLKTNNAKIISLIIVIIYALLIFNKQIHTPGLNSMYQFYPYDSIII